jgi:hypothetical protein
MPIVAEVAARLGKVLTRKAAAESPARTAEMAPAKAAAHVSAAAERAAHMSATTETAAHMSATTAAIVSTPTSPAGRKRVSGQSPGESGSRRQDDHGLT